MSNEFDQPIHSRGWNEYEIYVVSQLRTLTADVKQLTASVNELTLSNHSTRKDVSNLKRSWKFNGSKWGALTAFLVTFIATLLKHFWIKE